MLLTGGFEAHFALPVEPCVPVPGVHLQDRLEFAAATADAALHERHGASLISMRVCLFGTSTFALEPHLYFLPILPQLHEVLAAFATSLPVWSLTSHST